MAMVITITAIPIPIKGLTNLLSGLLHIAEPRKFLLKFPCFYFPVSTREL